MEKDYQRVWAECLGFIKDNLTGKENEKVFSTWFEPIVPVKLDGNTLIIQVPSPFFYEWLEQNYADLLKKAIQLTLGNEAGLQYSIVMATSISESPVTTRMPSTGRQSTINPPKDIRVQPSGMPRRLRRGRKTRQDLVQPPHAPRWRRLGQNPLGQRHRPQDKRAAPRTHSPLCHIGAVYAAVYGCRTQRHHLRLCPLLRNG